MSEKNSATIVNDLTEGSVINQLLRFATPLFLSNMLQAVYNVVDMVVVGQFIGKVGMSGVSIGGDILNFITFVSMGFGNAGQVLIAQYVGGKRFGELKKLIGNLFSVLATIAISFSIICLCFRNQILGLMNTPVDAWDYTMDYMVTCCIGLIFIYGYNVVSAILRGMGDSRHPFIFISIASILNMVLDILFVAVFDMEVFGAALATVIGQGISFITSIIYLIRHKENFYFDFKLSSFTPDKDALAAIIRLGIPMSIQSGAVRFSKLVVNSWINLFGVSFSALQGVASKIMTVAMLIAQSFTTAGSSTVGQCLGAKKYDRLTEVLKTLTYITISIFTLLSIVIYFKPRLIFSIFTNDLSVLDLAYLFIPAAIIDFYGAATRAPSFALINGSGFTRLNLIIALIDGVVARLGLSYLLGFIFDMGCQGLWIGEALAGFTPFIVGIVFYLSGKWRVK